MACRAQFLTDLGAIFLIESQGQADLVVAITFLQPSRAESQSSEGGQEPEVAVSPGPAMI